MSILKKFALALISLEQQDDSVEIRLAPAEEPGIALRQRDRPDADGS